MAERFFKEQLEKEAYMICAGQIPRNILSFYSGSESTRAADRLLAKGQTISHYPIPQTLYERMTVMGGIEWRIVGAVKIEGDCCLKTWSLEVAIIDKMGWEESAYFPWPLAESLFGQSREFERGRFQVKGVVNCCN